MEIDSTFKQLIKNSRNHARWLNSLSYLEYRGFRKIARALSTEEVDDGILTHTMEEVRHALYFKKLAMRVGGESFSGFHESALLCASAVKTYFFELDRRAAELARDLATEEVTRPMLYRLTTWLVEERALGIYQVYDRILLDAGFDFSLKPILADESRHLSETKETQVLRSIVARVGKSQLRAIEEECFRKLWLEISQSIH